MNIKDLKVVVSGGTSGLGRALVEQLAVRGARVVTFARRARPGLPQAIHFFEADISDKNQIYAIAAQAETALGGGVDVLIHNASTLGPTPLPLGLDLACEDFEAVLQANLLGPFRLTKALLPGMIRARRGLIVNLTSDAAVNGYPSWMAYGSSKAALEQMSRVWNAELEEYGVRVRAVDPGDMNTPMHLAAIPGADVSALKDPAESAKQLIELIAREGGLEVRSRL